MNKNKRLRKTIDDLDNLIDKTESKMEKELLEGYQHSLKELLLVTTDLYAKSKNLNEGERLTLKLSEDVLAKIEKEMSTLENKTSRSVRERLSHIFTLGYGESMKAIMQDKNFTPNFNKTELELIVASNFSGLTFEERFRRDRENLVFDLKQILTVGILQNKTYFELKEEIKTKMDMSNRKAANIARTESKRVRSEARQKAYSESAERGVVVKKQWISGKDSRTRKDHKRLDGQIKNTNEPFELGSKKAMQPGLFGDPKQDCNCRCRSIPYFDD